MAAKQKFSVGPFPEAWLPERETNFSPTFSAEITIVSNMPPLSVCRYGCKGENLSCFKFAEIEHKNLDLLKVTTSFNPLSPN